MRKAFSMTFAIMSFLAMTLPMPADAEVRFGRNVRIGGHDVSNQTFNRQRRGEYIIYRSAPRNAGCRWRTNSDGSRTKVCHLKRKRR